MHRMTQTFPPACCRMARNARQAPVPAAAPAAARPRALLSGVMATVCPRLPSLPARLGDMEKWQPPPCDTWLSEPSLFLWMCYLGNF